MLELCKQQAQVNEDEQLAQFIDAKLNSTVELANDQDVDSSPPIVETVSCVFDKRKSEQFLD